MPLPHGHAAYRRQGLRLVHSLAWLGGMPVPERLCCPRARTSQGSSEPVFGGWVVLASWFDRYPDLAGAAGGQGRRIALKGGLTGPCALVIGGRC